MPLPLSNCAFDLRNGRCCLAFLPMLSDSGSSALLLTALATMVGVVHQMGWGIESLPLKRFGRYGHVAAGSAILLCGTAIHLGL